RAPASGRPPTRLRRRSRRPSTPWPAIATGTWRPPGSAPLGSTSTTSPPTSPDRVATQSVGVLARRQTRGDDMKIAWLTNCQAPYREPMWREIAALADFKVSFLFRDEKIRHWTWRETADYPSSVVRTRRVPIPKALARRLDEPRMAMLDVGVANEVLDDADALIFQEWWQLAYVWCALRARLRGIPYRLYSESTLDSREFITGVPACFRSPVFRNAREILAPGPPAARPAISNGTTHKRIVLSVTSLDLSQFDGQVRE